MRFQVRTARPARTFNSEHVATLNPYVVHSSNFELLGPFQDWTFQIPIFKTLGIGMGSEFECCSLFEPPLYFYFIPNSAYNKFHFHSISFFCTGLHSASVPGILSLDVNPNNTNKILTGGADKCATVFNKDDEQVLNMLRLDCSAKIN